MPQPRCDVAIWGHTGAQVGRWGGETLTPRAHPLHLPITVRSEGDNAAL